MYIFFVVLPLYCKLFDIIISKIKKLSSIRKRTINDSLNDLTDVLSSYKKVVGNPADDDVRNNTPLVFYLINVQQVIFYLNTDFYPTSYMCRCPFNLVMCVCSSQVIKLLVKRVVKRGYQWERQSPFPYLHSYYVLSTDSREKTPILV